MAGEGVITLFVKDNGPPFSFEGLCLVGQQGAIEHQRLVVNVHCLELCIRRIDSQFSAGVRSKGDNDGHSNVETVNVFVGLDALVECDGVEEESSGDDASSVLDKGLIDLGVPSVSDKLNKASACASESESTGASNGSEFHSAGFVKGSSVAARLDGGVAGDAERRNGDGGENGEEGGLGGLSPGGQGFLNDVLDGAVFHCKLY